METIYNETATHKPIRSALHIAAIMIAAVFLMFGFVGKAYAATPLPIANASDLEAAFENGGTYVLTADVHSDDGFTLGIGKTLEIDLNEHKLTTGISDWKTTEEGYSYYYPTETRQFEVDGGTLILKDATGKGILSRNNTYIDVYVKNGGTLIIDGIEWRDEYAAKVMDPGSTLIMKSGKIQSYMGLLITEGASMEMQGGTIESSNGISCSTNATVKVSGGTADGYELAGNGRIEISGGTHDGNFYFYERDDLPNSASLIISGGKFSRASGKLIWNETENGTVNITGGYFAQDPSTWLKGEYVAADSDEYDGYPYEVVRLEPPTLSAAPYNAMPYDSIQLEWNNDVRGAHHYRIYESADGKAFTMKYDNQSLGSFLYNQSFEPGTTRYFYVTSVGSNGAESKPSNIAKATTKTKPAPIVPPKKDDPSGAAFNLLQAKAVKVTGTSVKIGWKKVPGAKNYIVYGNKCGTKNKYKKLTTTTKLTMNYTKVAGKKVKKGTYYKFIVYAVDSNGKVLSTSKTVHVATTGGKVGNDKKVTTAAKKGKVTLKKGKTFKLKAKAVPASKKLKVHRHRGMAYESSNKKIATVSSKGVIKGKTKGTCYVYAYTQNGVFAKVKVTVK